MELFIRLVNGQPFEHPIMGDNFRQAYPEIDTNNLPNNFAKFERVPKPSLVYAKFNNPELTYQLVDGIVKDVWQIIEMTPQEILEKQNATKSAWLNHPYQSWIFNENICQYEAPTPYPDDGKNYDWDEQNLTWIEI